MNLAQRFWLGEHNAFEQIMDRLMFSNRSKIKLYHSVGNTKKRINFNEQKKYKIFKKSWHYWDTSNKKQKNNESILLITAKCKNELFFFFLLLVHTSSYLLWNIRKISSIEFCNILPKIWPRGKEQSNLCFVFFLIYKLSFQRRFLNILPSKLYALSRPVKVPQ